MKFVVGSDHAGFALKEELVQALREWGHEVVDLGPKDGTSVDYPDYAHRVADAVAGDPAQRGLLVCGTGIGMAMAANRHPGVRAASCEDTYAATMTRSHNDANVLCLGARIVGPGLARSILDAFVKTPFEGGRHVPRVRKIERA